MKNARAISKIVMTKFCHAENGFIKLLCIMLSRVVAWISSPEWSFEIGERFTSDNPEAAAFTYAPSKTILLSNSDGEISGYWPAFNSS